MNNPLLTDDLATLLGQFPNDALHALTDILKRETSYSPFPGQRAVAAHEAAKGDDLRPMAADIAREILWWGSHDLIRQFSDLPTWPAVAAATAKSIGVPADARAAALPAWSVEDAMIARALAAWEKMSPQQREEAMRKAGADMDALRGAAAAGAGGIWVLGGAELLALIGVEAAGWVLAGAILAPLAVVAGMLWAIVDLSGPGYRVLRPAALTIAYTRKRLREAWINAAYES